MTTQSKSPSNKVAKVNKSLAQMNSKEKVQQANKSFMASFSGTEDEAKKAWASESGFAMQMFHNNPYLAKMDPVSIVTSVANVALTGLSLNPELKLAYLVPRKGKLYFQSSYVGKREILMRAGIVQMLDVELVYKNDVFKVTKGSDSKIIHEPDYFSDRGELKGGYWIATLLNGQKPFGVMPIQRINEIKARSESVKSGKGSPWDTDFNEMAKKTILNWGFKSLPKTNISASVLKSMEADSQLDNEEFDEWRKNQEEVNTDDFDDDASPEDNFTEAVVVEEEPDTSGEKAPLPTTPVPKDKPDPIQRIKDMKEQSESSTNEDERVVFDEKGNPIVVTVDKEIQPGLFPEV